LRGSHLPSNACREEWWSQTGSNRRPHACKARALPTELWPHWKPMVSEEQTLVGPGRFELPTPRLSSVCSNQLSYGPSPAAVAVPGLAITSCLPCRSTPELLQGIARRREVHGRETRTAVNRHMFCRDVQHMIRRSGLDSPTAMEFSKTSETGHSRTSLERR
jgi:hypothetical protein